MKGLIAIVTLSVLMLLTADGGAAWGQDEVTASPVRIWTVQADFVQKKKLKILVRPLVSEGRLVFRAPGSLRWEYREPFRSILLMDEGKVRKFVEQDGRLVEEKGVRLDAMQIVLGEISGWLEGKFDQNGTFTVRSGDAGTVRLIPREKSMQTFISGIDIELADQPGLLRSVILYEGPDSATELLFSRGMLNRPVDDALFRAP